MGNVLSTKKLKPDQKKILFKAGIQLQDYNAIQIVPLAFALPGTLSSVIFTSQHTVAIFMDKAMDEGLNLSSVRAYCVGSKTAGKVEQNGMEVIHYENYAEDLVNYIQQNHTEEHFTFFCGNRRRDTIPSFFLAKGISYSEIQIYNTELQPRHWQEEFDVVLFYSPSGVQSFFINNKISPQGQVVCIGRTTGAEARHYVESIEIAADTTVESVLEKTKELLVSLN